jgi:3-hydroxybutyrate dehydrogenase
MAGEPVPTATSKGQRTCPEETTLQLAGRVAAITGWTTAVGIGIARAYLAEGASVALLAGDAEEGELALARLGPTAQVGEGATGAGGRTMTVTGDASLQADVEGFIDATVARYGRIDVLVINAEDAAPTRPVVDVTDEEWDAVLGRVLSSAFWASRRALQVMIPAGSGRIMTVLAAGTERDPPASPALAAATGAVNGLTRSLAAAVAGTGITVNALSPGTVRAGPPSELPTATGIGRPNTVEEVAAIAVFLASDAGRPVNGAVVVVEGGTAHY